MKEGTFTTPLKLIKARSIFEKGSSVREDETTNLYFSLVNRGSISRPLVSFIKVLKALIGDANTDSHRQVLPDKMFKSGHKRQ
jgi:hypothetical protein